MLGITGVAAVGCGGAFGADVLGGGGLNLFMSDAPPLNVTAVNITIDRIEAHVSGIWADIETEQQTIDLLTLTQNETMIGSAMVPSGNFNQIKLYLSKVTVTDDTGTHDVQIVGAGRRGLKLNIDGKVEEGTVEVLLDFNLEKSLIRTGNGKYKLKPVINVILRDLAGSISGFAVNDGGALYGVHVDATYVDGPSYNPGTVVNTSSSIMDGSFKVWALKEGVYDLDFELYSPEGLLTHVAASEGVVVIAGQNTDVGDVEHTEIYLS